MTNLANSLLAHAARPFLNARGRLENPNQFLLATIEAAIETELRIIGMDLDIGVNVKRDGRDRYYDTTMAHFYSKTDRGARLLLEGKDEPVVSYAEAYQLGGVHAIRADGPSTLEELNAHASTSPPAARSNAGTAIEGAVRRPSWQRCIPWLR